MINSKEQKIKRKGITIETLNKIMMTKEAVASCSLDGETQTFTPEESKEREIIDEIAYRNFNLGKKAGYNKGKSDFIKEELLFLKLLSTELDNEDCLDEDNMVLDRIKELENKQ